MSKIVRLLSQYTGLHDALVQKIMFSAPARYKRYQIPKRNGGFRQIAQPAREVKLLQRAFVQTTLRHLPIHEAATAYREGVSLRVNATRHAGNGPILKMDFQDFFPSITHRDWIKYCHEFSVLADDIDIALTSRLPFQRPKGSVAMRLAIGAPSSPMLSNVLMFAFDTRISNMVGVDRVTYTRYADDLTFSAPRTGHLTNVARSVGAALGGLDYPKLRVNHDKTTYVTKKYGRRVTGLTLTNDGHVTIGRDKKRQLNAAVHRASNEQLSVHRVQQLAGYLAFVNAVEPGFLDVLRRRYGSETVLRIQKTVILGSRSLNKADELWRSGTSN